TTRFLSLDKIFGCLSPKLTVALSRRGEKESAKQMAPKNLSFKIILGSSSMARRKILADMGYEFTVMGADIDEKRIRKDNAEELVVALAEAKMLSCQGSKQLIIWRKIPIPLC
ncbi:hypothetical protein AABB24_004117, partial [Solanum stoloniferum]